MSEINHKKHSFRPWDVAFLLAGIGMVILFTTRYQMPFRLDDVLLMEWANHHSLLDAFDPIKGQIVNSVRPMFAITSCLLTHGAGSAHPFWWHITLTTSLLIGIAYTGLTARYLSGRDSALQISVVLYFVVFTSILNVFFWYSDLTYGLELLFTAPAWYYGLRGMYEARSRLWLASMMLGCLAVLSKEPAVVLVHVVLAGSLILRWTSIKNAWSTHPKKERRTAILAYLVLAAVTFYILLVSPTRSNRFFSFSSPDLGYFVRDRIQYYSAVYASPIARLLLFAPILYVVVRGFFFRNARPAILIGLVAASLVASLFLVTNILVALSIMFATLCILATRNGPESDNARALLPFAVSLLIACVTLLFTIQLVKTQLTEAALLTAILSAWAWTIAIEDVTPILGPLLANRNTKLIAIPIGVILVGVGIAFALPKLKKQEKLLREVRDVRRNANEAIQWAAAHLPEHSMFAVTSYGLHGIEHGEMLTAKDDETKLRQQYTFVGGYVYTYLEQLGRHDIQHAYLEDTTTLRRVLNAMRSEPDQYVFLQSELDLNLFHRAGEQLLQNSDTLVAHFAYGPYPTEIWHLRNQ